MNLETLLRSGRKFNASDIHVVVGLPPLFRVDGEIVTTRGDAVTKELSRALAYEGLNEVQRQTLDRDWQLCYSRSFGDLDRARITVYFRNSCPELSIRLSEPHIRTREELGLPVSIDDLARKPNGMILITGPTGTGKTTTFNYLIDRVNSEFRRKIVTIEDPIEFAHTSKRSVVVQQELLSDVKGFYQALIHVLRQDPDVIGVGEMRDQDTVRTALMAAETGHLVIATLHTPDAVQSVQRMIATFDEHQQNEVRMMIANAVQAVIAQQLLPHAQGKGRVLCCEILMGTPAVRHNIRENTMHKLHTEIQAGRKFGMISMDHALLELYQKGDISYDTAMTMARDPTAMKERTA